MKRCFLFLMALGLLMAAPAYAETKVNVFACEPEWAALAKEIGGDKVETFAATTARQDPHHVRAKPSLIAAMRKADLVVCSGASLEVGWLPILLQKAGNANAQPGASGFLLAADVVPMLEKPIKLDRAEGDIHPEGNPHVHLNPHNIALVAKELNNRLKTVDPSNAGSYQVRYHAFSQKWQRATAHWESEAVSLKSVPVVAHHKSFTYLLDWLGMKEAGTLEPKPGIPPTTSHLESLLQKLRSQPARIIIRTPYDSADASLWLTEKTGMQAAVLPFTVGGDAESADLFGLFDQTIALLKGANRGQ
jgi:zinc/manganese transport system substrate-binding protein